MIKHFFILSCSLILLSCVSTTSEWKSDEIEGVGSYTPPPPNINRKSLAVLEFKDKTGGNREDAAIDQMTTLLLKTRRFRIIERARLDDVLKEQNMEGIVDPNTMAQKRKVKGAELLCYGSLTNFEVKTTRTRNRGGILNRLPISVLDIDFKKEKLDFDIGVDVRIVDSTTGEVIFAESADVKRTETASAMGLELVGISARGDGSIRISNNNQGKLLRMALDKVVKKMLRDIDYVNTYYD
ncbi:CsgG/HfaB family protein [Candidatus Uabimicrobium amorphum]|uniref:Curli production assembly/transport componentCsgG n=1 Tax=Uabimicrobium amorphum TaxID=2596890 RepID=A0A5S9IMK1_UABAM|nr:CsgG/HfaB family protein [Candidatus Uabimicrobium amorphum]BBM84629.1 curli production assembly/transport componentCsgG [Candidatus Uabimicrobium amorphum]